MRKNFWCLATSNAGPAFVPLKDKKISRAAKIEFGTLSWDDGKIDIAPEYLYDYGTPYESSNES